MVKDYDIRVDEYLTLISEIKRLKCLAYDEVQKTIDPKNTCFWNAHIGIKSLISYKTFQV